MPLDQETPFDLLSSMSPLYECIKCGYPFQNARFLLLSTNLARERLQIDTDLLLTITSTADELSGATNIDDLERPWTPWVFSEFFAISSCDVHLKSEFSPKLLEIDQSDNLRMKLNCCCRASHEHQLRFVVYIVYRHRWIKDYHGREKLPVHESRDITSYRAPAELSHLRSVSDDK